MSGLTTATLNTVNALWTWLAGMVVSAGYGWTLTGWVGCALALGGLAVWVVALLWPGAKARPDRSGRVAERVGREVQAWAGR